MIAELDRGGWRPTHILITHYDVDHIGNMARISQHFAAAVRIPRQDVPYVTGEKSRPGIKRTIGAVMKVALPSTWSAIDADEIVGRLTALASPGHTPGHLAYGNGIRTVCWRRSEDSDGAGDCESTDFGLGCQS